MTVRLCAWCKRVLGHVEPYEDHSVTHTICLACNKECFSESDDKDEKEKMDVLQRKT